MVPTNPVEVPRNCPPQDPEGTWAVIWLRDPAMPGEEYDASAMITFSGTERGSESGRKREDLTTEEQFHEMVQTDW